MQEIIDIIQQSMQTPHLKMYYLDYDEIYF